MYLIEIYSYVARWKWHLPFFAGIGSEKIILNFERENIFVKFPYDFHVILLHEFGFYFYFERVFFPIL